MRTLMALLCLFTAGCGGAFRFEQRNSTAPWRTVAPRYNSAFFSRHNPEYRFSAGVHYSHGKAHDDLELTPLAQANYFDALMDADYVEHSYAPPLIEPSMMYWGPYTGQSAWKLYQAIDWTHHHHEMTYDILSEKSIPWDQKREWTDHAVEVYLERYREVARSPAVLEMTMRRAATMMKPYFGVFRNSYPKANNYFFVAHWWHPVIYEAMMIAGNDAEQDVAVAETHAVTFREVFAQRPLRMLLSREAMPRYSRMSPESANIFDNLHMLHGIAYDIMAFEGWSIQQKRDELYRVVKAMAYQKGDEAYVRKFSTPYPDMDPRVYHEWMRTYDGEMNRIMEQMFVEMWPAMSPDGSATPPPDVMEQVRLKLTPGMQAGEIAGSLHDAVKKLVPGMKMQMDSMAPGAKPEKMADAMFRAWIPKAKAMTDVPTIAMDVDPVLSERSVR